MLYNSIPGPRDCLLGSSNGGAWVLWFGKKRSDGSVVLEGSSLKDDELMELAAAQMEGADSY